MKRNLMGAIVLASGVIASATGAVAADKIPVVATFSILGDFVTKVGGDRIALRTIVGPEGDAHVYQPTPKDAADIAKARIVFANGLGFEGWMERLVAASGYKGPIVVATAGVKALKAEAEEHEHGKTEQQDAKEGHDAHSGDDPHAWQSVANAKLYVANVKTGLCQADIAGCADYTKNAAAYTAELDALETEIKTRIAQVPETGRKVITSHDAFGYFAHAYGVTFLAPTGVSTESEASAKDVAKLIDQIRAEKVKAVFVENVTDTRLVEQIARETGAKIGGTLYSDALSKTDGPAASYAAMMRHNLKLLSAAMLGS